jgi:hypothetical protein
MLAISALSDSGRPLRIAIGEPAMISDSQTILISPSSISPRSGQQLGDHRVEREAGVAVAVGDRDDRCVVATGEDPGDVVAGVDACVEQAGSRDEEARGRTRIDEAHPLADDVLECVDLGVVGAGDEVRLVPGLLVLLADHDPDRLGVSAVGDRDHVRERSELGQVDPVRRSTPR